MNKTAKIVAFLALMVLILSAGFYYLKNKQKEGSEPTPIKTSSIKGCYVAKLAKDVYTIIIQSEEDTNVTGMVAYNNYQKDSSSGSFVGTFLNNVLTGNYSFDSEGMHSDRQLMFKKVGDDLVQGFGPVEVINGKETFISNSITYDTKSTFVKSDSCTNLFTENNNTFSFLYNPFFFAYELEEQTPTTEWGLNSNSKNGLVLANVIIPKTFMPGTNFSDARFTVGRSTDPGAINDCAIKTTESKILDQLIGGYPFTQFEFSEGAAGNFYDTTSYRGIVDGDCYAIEYTIHSTNIGNYSPDQEVKEFDASKIQDEFEKIIKSFEFIVNRN